MPPEGLGMTGPDVRFERRILDGFGRLLLSEHDLEAAAIALEQALPRMNEASGILSKHKVTTVAAQNVQLIVERARIAQEKANLINTLLEVQLVPARAHRDLLELQVEEVAKATADAGLAWAQVTILKGFSNGRFYPSPYRRWMRDLDLFTESWRDAHILVEKLLELGYSFDRAESPWVKADEICGQAMYGQIFLVRPEGDDVARVDVHFGTYSIGYSGYLRAGFRDLAATMQLPSGEVGVLKPEGCLVLAQAHALSDGYVAIKDVNDFVAIAASGERVDWERVGRELRKHELRPQAGLLARHCLRLYDDAAVRRAGEALIKAIEPPRTTIWRTHDRSWRLRALVNQ